MKNLRKNQPLPSEGEVIIELEDYLTKLCRPTTPREATNELARRFELNNEQQNRIVPSGAEERWYNRVRQARRKLNNRGKLDRSQPRGKWAVKSAP